MVAGSEVLDAGGPPIGLKAAFGSGGSPTAREGFTARWPLGLPAPAAVAAAAAAAAAATAAAAVAGGIGWAWVWAAASGAGAKGAAFVGKIGTTLVWRVA